jgi:aromatic ring-opening dioxygenase catalytic subunit (LigB family)
MLTSHALLAPILPTLLMDEHRQHHTEMLNALAAASERLLAESPVAVVVLSARWAVAGPFRVDASRRHATLTDYAGLGVEVRHDCDGHPALAKALVEAGLRDRVHVAAAKYGVDSGVTVPMHFLAPRAKLRVVPLSLPPRPAAECRAWGACIRRTLAAWPERVAFVAGGVLSRNEHAWNLRRVVPESAAFDAWALDALARGAWDELGRRSAAMVKKAQPEAGLRHLEVMRGFLGNDATGTVRCYESGPGVGEALVEFDLAEVEHAPDVAAGGAT